MYQLKPKLHARQAAHRPGLSGLWLVQMSPVRIPVGILRDQGEFTVEAKPHEAMAPCTLLLGRMTPPDDVMVSVPPDAGQQPEVRSDRDSNDNPVHYLQRLKISAVLGKI